MQSQLELTRFKIDGNHLGVVIMAEAHRYPAKEESESEEEFAQKASSFHIEAAKEDIYAAFEKELFDKFKVTLDSGVVGHEHGSDLGKCHMQCVFKLAKRTQKMFPPGSITVGEERLLYIVQSVKNPVAAFKYCKKEGDYFNTGEDDDSMCPYKEIANTPGLELKDVITILAKKDPKGLLQHGDKVISNWASFQPEPEKPVDPFQFPEYILKQMLVDTSGLSEEEIHHIEGLKHIYDWYSEFCISKQWEGKRKKALMIFSKERHSGKSKFCESLLKDPAAYLLHIKTNIDGREFAKAKNAQLLLLDDIAYKPEQLELWKALVASEKTTLSTKYCMHTWSSSIPTIILSNDPELLTLFVTSPLFSTQVKIVEIEKYMGPPNTLPEFLTKKEHHLSASTKLMLEKKRHTDQPLSKYLKKK